MNPYLILACIVSLLGVIGYLLVKLSQMGLRMHEKDAEIYSLKTSQDWSICNHDEENEVCA